jgi:hypothetical protein
MIDIQALRVYSPGYQATHWGIDYSQIVDRATALAQPISVAALPVYYDCPNEFSYLPEYADLNATLFDLVLLIDIEYRSQTELITWIESKKITNWLLCVGGITHNTELDDRVIYNPTWMTSFLKYNQDRDDFPMDRSFLFDCLCGTRRTHRDFVMLSLMHSGLLDRSIVTYRDIFVGGDCVDTPDHVQAEFPGLRVPWPYVSANLDPAWEVADTLNKSISDRVPWEIYHRTWYSILVETLGYGSMFLAAEKIGKCLHARRLFVHFGAAHYLQNLRSLGFETFDSVLDESYDRMFKNDIRRWHMAFDQVIWLSQQNPVKLLKKIKPILDHNHDRLQRLITAKRIEMRRMILDRLGDISEYKQARILNQ